MTIVKSPNIKSGQPRIDGTRITVKRIYHAVQRSGSHKEVADELDIDLEDVDEAIQFVKENPEEIQEVGQEYIEL